MRAKIPCESALSFAPNTGTRAAAFPLNRFQRLGAIGGVDGRRPSAQPSVIVATTVSSKQSAGLLLYRLRVGGIEVLLGHPGGPFWRKKDLGSWSVPKGLIASGETLLAAAKREFAEETGHRPRGKSVSLDQSKQPGGKIVHVWAVEQDWDAANLKSNMFEIEGPPPSGRRQMFPELDRAAWFEIEDARAKILKGQAVFLDRLLAAIAGS
jgi:predicted NUDIX family NTP pyrophosphohydrolase